MADGARPTVDEVVAASRPMFEARGAQSVLQLERTDAVLEDGWWADLGVALQKVARESGYEYDEIADREVNLFIAGLTVGLEFTLNHRERRSS